VKKDLLSVADLTGEEIYQLINRAIEFKKGSTSKALSRKSVALLFEKPSLRTRVSFELAVEQLGGHAMYLSPAEVGLGKREPAEDVARVLARLVDAIVARTFSHHTLQVLAGHTKGPVINALSDVEHPCQALADVFTIFEKKGRLKGVDVTYIGDGNNCAHSLFLACVLTGANFRIATPAGYEMNPDIVTQGKRLAALSGSTVSILTKPEEATRDTDVVYTDVWTSMGQESEAVLRRAAFAGYQVNAALMAKARKDAIIMHPLPAHYGEEVAIGILDTPASAVFDEAENRLHIQKAVIERLFKE